METIIVPILVAVVAGGLGIVLTFFLTRNKEVTQMAHAVIASTNTYFNVIETLKKVAFVQGQRIDQWEWWGQSMTDHMDQMIRRLEQCGVTGLPDPPEMPSLHLDLSPYWREIDAQIADMNKPDEKRAREKPPFNSVGSTDGAPSI